MAENNWRELWSGRCADQTILGSGDIQRIFMELKRSNGFDVVKDGISYESFLGQYSELKKRLSLHLPDGEGIRSVYEVGCGSGANLFLFEQDGTACGGMDYSPGLLQCAKQVLRTTDIRCEEACNLSTRTKYDAVISVSVFGYFTDIDYAEAVLEKMCRKAEHSVGILELADVEKEAAYTAYRKQIIPDYEQRYRGLPRLFYSRDFFEAFALRNNMEIQICPMHMKDYWNSQFYFDCYLYKR
ncbi:class I SAM-dependent methyltransferase [Pseudoflavonifractor sp. 524-17]|nr:class I SAM-dependent methyltransferase [Pseudoflavonifractor sp. 524-17]